ncbi:Crp/Fnr family transcriptional regulator [Methylobacterium sp. SyP6R]|uniref:Crp/Fnr family transcriptional regulator n=1 Tax=Methylobacterium sp. SyP6R TaxID=2718876 RepID=UPI001F29F783|nr:Crp/Fnr family transcriptional regulator [Methylobacterium sp. SyP6R]MCF4124526.1 Crp/Fnr family transcriptional regulator [Methylobacterium sp. SyP6R]
MTSTSTMPHPASVSGPCEPLFHPIVRKLTSYGGLDHAEQSALATLSAGGQRVDGRLDLLVEGTVPDNAVLILEGVACRYRHRPSGARQITAYLLPGDLCDPDLMYLSRMTHSVGTLCPCRIARIPREAMAGLTERHPGIARALRHAKLAEEETTREWVMNIGCRSAIERVSHLLCELHERLRIVGWATKGGYDLALTQQDIADTTGLSNVHVNRVLRQLRLMRLVEVGGRRVDILDHPGLQAVAEFQPGYLRPTSG